MIQMDRIGLASMFVESVLYGISVVLYIIAMVILLRRRGRNRFNTPMACAIVIMWCMGTVHVGIDICRILEAFVESPLGPKVYLAQISTNLYVVRSSAYMVQTLTGDGFVLYRLYLVWGGDKYVFYPMLVVFLGDIAAAGGAIHRIAFATAGTVIFQAKAWITAFYVLTLVSHSICTFLLGWRIWSVHRQTAKITVGISDVSLMTAAIIVVESGAIYSLSLVIQLTLFLCGTFAQYIMIDSTTQLVGIVFSLVIVRVGLGLTVDASSGSPIKSSFLPRFVDSTSTRRPDAYPLDPVEVHVSKVVARDDVAHVLPMTLQECDYELDRRSPDQQSKFQSYGANDSI
ncbi:hypothetical protein BDW22DRAFT_1357621 [Trametopsis cervina]|nr:hypothetical protein BDW22DRAFT_1357621 [Trametopsis cervina]